MTRERLEETIRYYESEVNFIESVILTDNNKLNQSECIMASWEYKLQDYKRYISEYQSELNRLN